MKRTIAIIILSVCLIGAGGWGAFTTYQLEEQENITRSLEYQYYELNQINTDISNQLNRVESKFFNLNTQADNLLIKTQLSRADIESYLNTNDLAVKLEKITANIDEFIRANTEISNELHRLESDLRQAQQHLEAATFELGKDMPVKPSLAKWFDCDDSAAYMFYYFTNMGYEVDIVKGNLDLTGEWQLGCDHVWVVVHSDGVAYPYDWGEYCSDPQHYEYYEIGFIELLLAGIIG